VLVQQGLLASVQQAERQVVHLERLGHDTLSISIIVLAGRTKRQAGWLPRHPAD
jgi:hypothetical protein